MFISDRLNSKRFYSDRLYSDRLKFDAFNFDRFNSEGTDLIGFIPQWSKGTIYAHGGQCSGLKESFLFLEIVYFLFLGGSEAAMGGGGGAQSPVWGGNELKKTGAHRARSRTRGQIPLVIIGFTSFHRLCKRLNLSGGLSGLPEEVVDDPKKKKRQPKSVKCERCGVPLRDKYVLKRHVSVFLFFRS